MIRKVFKNNRSPGRFDAFLQRYNLPRELFSTNRRTVTKALLVGLFIALIPMPGQMAAVVFLAPLFRYNVVLSLVMVWLTNPVTMPFIYYAEYEIGVRMLMLDGANGSELSLEWFTRNFEHIVLPLYAGAIVLASVVSVAAYFTVNWFWVRSVKKEQERRN